jgi:hypothetical protein
MKQIFWTVFGMALGATITYLLIKPEKEDENDNNNLPLFVMKKAKGSINDQVFAGIQSDDDVDWL